MKLVILDRDGVIDPQQADQLVPRPGSLEAIARLHRHGYRVLLTSHEPGIARGETSMEVLSRRQARLLEAVRHKGGEIEAIAICPHAGQHCCRPHPGLLEEIAERLKINLTGIYVAGTTAIDAEAARAAGALPALLHMARAPAGLDDVPVFDHLPAFVETLLRGELRGAA
jgi:D-glycero-D-manno-heptose 1,7-bisphosphate phosphatase